MSIFLVWLIDWLIKVTPFIVAGYIFSKWQGANAILLNIACIPFWLEMYVMPDGISIEIINSQNQQVHFALGLFKILPSLGFLIIIPLVSMFLSKNRSIKFWVAISSFLIISFLCLLYAIFIRNPNAVFVFSKFTTWIFFTTILWMPILLGIIIYSDNNFG